MFRQRVEDSLTAPTLGAAPHRLQLKVGRSPCEDSGRCVPRFRRCGGGVLRECDAPGDRADEPGDPSPYFFEIVASGVLEAVHDVALGRELERVGDGPRDRPDRGVLAIGRIGGVDRVSRRAH